MHEEKLYIIGDVGSFTPASFTLYKKNRRSGFRAIPWYHTLVGTYCTLIKMLSRVPSAHFLVVPEAIPPHQRFAAATGNRYFTAMLNMQSTINDHSTESDDVMLPPLAPQRPATKAEITNIPSQTCGWSAMQNDNEQESETGYQIPSFNFAVQNGTMETITETFSYSDNSVDQSLLRSSAEPQKSKGAVPRPPPQVDTSATPKVGTRKSQPFFGSSDQICSPRHQNNTLSINSSSSDSWDSFENSNKGDKSREVSLLDIFDSRDDSDCENECEEPRDIDEMISVTFNYQNEANNRSSVGDGLPSPSFAGSTSLSLPKMAQGPYSHLRDSSRMDSSRWMGRFYQKDMNPPKDGQESCVTEEQFLYSAEQREKQKTSSEENSRPDMQRQDSGFFTPLVSYAMWKMCEMLLSLFTDMR